MNPVESFIGGLLDSAKAKHAEAMSALSARPIDIERCRAAEQQLADAELLLVDAIDTLDDVGAHEAIQLSEALAELKVQRDLLAEGLAKYDFTRKVVGVLPQPTLWSTPWPWLSLTFIVVALLGVLT